MLNGDLIPIVTFQMNPHQNRHYLYLLEMLWDDLILLPISGFVSCLVYVALLLIFLLFLIPVYKFIMKYIYYKYARALRQSASTLKYVCEMNIPVSGQQTRAISRAFVISSRTNERACLVQLP